MYIPYIHTYIFLFISELFNRLLPMFDFFIQLVKVFLFGLTVTLGCLQNIQKD